ncbi:hypothetical protein HYFRA_00003124 [Hymenoscyphus fraxineus]|uniref:Prokaryotic-type class I peptide chain release factors domain-containing protein n=1 Tax=Hymenoscyphus fraxineus TaxID=746836 RepID=A0A9N9KSR6_9HELO|nr:hypothetical protein HYFRA_00003124 [Hymenoscyphus fraxineus]
MLTTRLLRSCLQASTSTSHPIQITSHIRPYSSKKDQNENGNADRSEHPDFEVARQWFRSFNPAKPMANETWGTSTGVLPSAKIATTEYSRASGPGGQKVNKSSTKATTAWPLNALLKYVPKALHQGLRDSGYYVASSDAIKISCDSNRTQTENREETHARFCAEIEKIYRKSVPGVTSEDQKEKVSEL